MRTKIFLPLAFLLLLLLPASASAGVNFGMMTQEPILSSDAKKMAAGGITSYRYPMSWFIAQSHAGAPYNWAGHDSAVRVAAQNGLTILPIMMSAPKGITDTIIDFPIDTPSQRRGWKEYLQKAIARYGPGGTFWAKNPDVPRRPIRTWQIWNEANFSWFATTISPRRYLQLLKQSHQVIKRADPGARVMLSSFFGTPSQAGAGINSHQFLNSLYALGAAPYFDDLSLHPYAPNVSSMIDIIEKNAAIIRKHGDQNTPLHITEIGWGSDSATAYSAGSPMAQAKRLRSALGYLVRNQGKFNIQSIYWFVWKDLPRSVSTCNLCYSSGLFYHGPGLKPKPSWKAFVDIARN